MPLPVGAEAPDFSLKDQNNQVVRLSDFHGRKAVLLVFYPFTFTGTCQGELAAVRDNLDAFQNERVQVLAVSVDSVYSHKVWASQEGFDFPLLADFWPHGEVARAYEVFHEEGGMANRGTFLVDPAGTIQYSEMIGPGESRDVKAWLAAVRA
ncbi:putative peroxiredoxin (thioredoxin reductase) AhpE [Paractinoplanes deccanensis]|uniref:Peroxiredoxin (Thioredoxin reductase) AhpE n=1 Tax=Paractinoplanes deccanensis TaxID=113561 RepID=A0ABQ3Y6V5_9ACTN|nr:peroxiredoxin [Actinoplanes deccanensis]GID75700.1 putative peroxiredoxin (thioredoxin reductase) AhpE [Actinoplanes deccanensis]